MTPSFIIVFGCPFLLDFIFAGRNKNVEVLRSSGFGDGGKGKRH